MTTVKTQNERIEALERAVFHGYFKEWVKIGEAAAILGLSPSTLRRRCQLRRYKKAWKWNVSRTERLFNIQKWREVKEWS